MPVGPELTWDEIFKHKRGRMREVEVKFKRERQGVDLPEYKTEGAACFDLQAAEPCCLGWRQSKTISLGWAVEIPPGYKMAIHPRSGWSKNHPNYLANQRGTIDCDYRGEIRATIVNNNAGKIMRIDAGDRIVQGEIVPVYKCVPVEVYELSETERGTGGFGSTGL